MEYSDLSLESHVDDFQLVKTATIIFFLCSHKLEPVTVKVYV